MKNRKCKSQHHDASSVPQSWMSWIISVILVTLWQGTSSEGCTYEPTEIPFPAIAAPLAET